MGMQNTFHVLVFVDLNAVSSAAPTLTPYNVTSLGSVSAKGVLSVMSAFSQLLGQRSHGNHSQTSLGSHCNLVANKQSRFAQKLTRLPVVVHLCNIHTTVHRAGKKEAAAGNFHYL
jgi:hypothetical protein